MAKRKADTFAAANARYERNFARYGYGSKAQANREARIRSGGRVANYSGATNRRDRGGSMVRGTSTYSRGSQFAIARAAAANRNANKPRMLSLNRRTGIYEASSEGRR